MKMRKILLTVLLAVLVMSVIALPVLAANESETTAAVAAAQTEFLCLLLIKDFADESTAADSRGICFGNDDDVFDLVRRKPCPDRAVTGEGRRGRHHG